MLKAILGLIAAIAIVMFGLWASFAFVTLELNPFKWSEPARVLFVSIFGTGIPMFIALYCSIKETFTLKDSYYRR